MEEPDALISLNADSQAFYVLNQGKDVIRTREQQKAKRIQDKEDKDKKKREDLEKKRVLEVEQVERLKDKLNKHMQEIRQLFGVKTTGDVQLGEDDGNLDGLPPGEVEDPLLANTKLIDQILKIKLLINENRRQL